MSCTGEIDDVYTDADEQGEGITDDQADEEGLAFAVERDAADFEDDGFEGPGDKDREDGALDGVEGDNGESDGVKGPPGESVLTDGEHDHDEGTP